MLMKMEIIPSEIRALILKASSTLERMSPVEYSLKKLAGIAKTLLM